MNAKMRVLRMACLGLLLSCLVWPTMAAGQEEADLQARLTHLVAHFLGVPEELLKVTSVEQRTRHGLPVHSVRATLTTPDGRTVGGVYADIDIDGRYVVSAGRLDRDTEDVVRIAAEFARATFPAWSDRMVLQYAQRSRDEVICRWVERDGAIWTGTFVGFTCTIDRPGVPAVYSAYIGTPRSPDDTWLTEEQAKDVARGFLADHGYEGEVEFAEMHLDDLHRRFPHWWVAFQAKRQGAPADERPVTVNVLLHAVTGEVVVPR